MNRELMAKVRAHIASGADVDMDEWRCGTAACIGGWAVQLAGHTVLEARRSFLDWLMGEAPAKYCVLGASRTTVHDAAQALLGLTDREADSLFYIGEWPGDLADAYDDAIERYDAVAMRAIVLERIDRLMGVTLDDVAAAARHVARTPIASA